MVYTIPLTWVVALVRTAKLFRNGRSQALRLPAEYRFEGSEVYIRKDPKSGDIILSRRPDSWQDFFDLTARIGVPDEFLSDRDHTAPQKRRLF
jgi:antitoxin VapB